MEVYLKVITAFHKVVWCAQYSFVCSFPVFWYILTIHCQHWIRLD